MRECEGHHEHGKVRRDFCEKRKSRDEEGRAGPGRILCPMIYQYISSHEDTYMDEAYEDCAWALSL
jgi:hypothetical protein